ncbi:SSS family solute/sodium (Na+) symporter [Rhodococcus triatomae BKS 15-14]|nr:SSS family solute/sodium (Na+) symporter [Rhodococcus triatomae BKS 15-14]
MCSRPDVDAAARLISLGIALILGTSGLPHVLVHLYTVPSEGGRSSVTWAI